MELSATAQQDGVQVPPKAANGEFILTSGSNAPPNRQQAGSFSLSLSFPVPFYSSSLHLSSEEASVAHEAASTNEAMDSGWCLILMLMPPLVFRSFVRRLSAEPTIGTDIGALAL